MVVDVESGSVVLVEAESALDISSFPKQLELDICGELCKWYTKVIMADIQNKSCNK